MKDSKLAEGGLGKKRDIRLAKKLIKGLQGIDTPAAKEMKALMNEVLAGGYKPVKKKDGGSVSSRKSFTEKKREERIQKQVEKLGGPKKTPKPKTLRQTAQKQLERARLIQQFPFSSTSKKEGTMMDIAGFKPATEKEAKTAFLKGTRGLYEENVPKELRDRIKFEKPQKKKDGGLMKAIEKVKAKKMKEGGDVDKEFPEPKKRTAEFRIEMIPKEFRKSFREKFMSGRGETSRKIEEKAKGGPIRRRPKAFRSRLDDAVEEFIETIEPFQGTVRKGETLRNIDGKTMIVRRTPNPNFGNMISDRDREMIGAMLGEGGRMISDADRRMVSQMMGARRMEDGGVVPAKFKGFSKLPEDVQQKMNPTLAKKFKKGGAVKMGSGGGVCRGMGAARAGGKFKLR